MIYFPLVNLWIYFTYWGLRFANRSARFMHAYKLGLNGQQTSWANKKYHGHRVLPLSIIRELEEANI